MRTVGALPFFIQLIEKEKGKKTSGVIYAWDFQVNLRLRGNKARVKKRTKNKKKKKWSNFDHRNTVSKKNKARSSKKRRLY